MAFINCDFSSETLGMAMNMKVIIPNENSDTPISEKKVLYLLHGLSDDNTAWSRNTSIERYAKEADMVVVMPTAHKSFYTNTEAGEKFYDFIAYEVPKKAQKLFGLSSLKEKNYIAGLSMGGYGALKIGLTNPHSFNGIASLSGAVEIGYVFCNCNEREKEVLSVFGTLKPDDSNCLLKILQNQVKNNVPLPDIYQCCGTEDYLYEGNINFKNLAESLGISYKYWESPGVHEWGFWDANIKIVIDYFSS